MSQLTAEELTALKSKAKDVRIDILKMITKAIRVVLFPPRTS